MSSAAARESASVVAGVPLRDVGVAEKDGESEMAEEARAARAAIATRRLQRGALGPALAAAGDAKLDMRQRRRSVSGGRRLMRAAGTGAMKAGAVPMLQLGAERKRGKQVFELRDSSPG